MAKIVFNAIELRPNCYVCREYMGPFRNDFSICTAFSDRPIWKIFGRRFHKNLICNCFQLDFVNFRAVHEPQAVR